MKCTECLELFTDAAYRELDENTRSEFDVHLSTCAECRLKFTEFTATLTVMDHYRRDEPDKRFWENYWDNLSPRLVTGKDGPVQQPQPARSSIFWRPAPVWAYGIAAVVLVVVGVFLGRVLFISPPPAEPLVQETRIQPGVDTTTERTLAYLERSKNLLIGLVNLSEAHRSSIDFTQERRVSRELIDQANVLKVALNRPDKQQLRQLVQDLEIILLQLANIEVKPGTPVIEFVEKGVDQKSILLKINLEEMRAAGQRNRQPEKNSKHSL